MQIQKGIGRDSTLATFVVGVHSIIERFITLLRIDDAIGTYLPHDNRMKLADSKALTLLIHNILTTPNALYEMEDWLKPLDVVKLGLQPDQAMSIQDVSGDCGGVPEKGTTSRRLFAHPCHGADGGFAY